MAYEFTFQVGTKQWIDKMNIIPTFMFIQHETAKSLKIGKDPWNYWPTPGKTCIAFD